MPTDLDLGITSDTMKIVRRVQKLLSSMYPKPSPHDLNNVYSALLVIMAEMSSDYSDEEIEKAVGVFRYALTRARQLNSGE